MHRKYCGGIEHLWRHLLVAGKHVSGQVVDIYVYADGGEQVAGLNLRAQLGDGGPALGGADVTPAMTADIIGPGTIFAPNNVGMFDSSIPPSFVDQFTTTNFGTIALSPGANLLATLTFDTTGFVYGLWPLLLSGTVDGNTDFFDVPIDIANGFIFVEPEPSAIVSASLALLGLCAAALGVCCRASVHSADR